MKMMKHTPGPWTVSPNDDTRVTGTVNGRRYIASIDNAGTPEAPANARLIAAAPELMAALEDMTAKLIELRDEHTSDGFFGGQTTEQRRANSAVYSARIIAAAADLLPLIDQAETAIAKATLPQGERQ